MRYFDTQTFHLIHSLQHSEKEKIFSTEIKSSLVDSYYSNISLFMWSFQLRKYFFPNQQHDNDRCQMWGNNDSKKFPRYRQSILFFISFDNLFPNLFLDISINNWKTNKSMLISFLFHIKYTYLLSTLTIIYNLVQ